MSCVRSQSSHSLSAGRSPTSRKRRSMVKCESCRKKRIKCMPTIRTWPGQRCVPCEEHDLPCGPNVHSRQSTTTKSGNTSCPELNLATGCIESHSTKTAHDSIWEGVNDLDCALRVTNLEADWTTSFDYFDMSLDCLFSMPIEESRFQEETWPGTAVSHSDESSRESLSALPGLGSSAQTDDLSEIDQSFIRLGELRILFEAVESRTRAVASLVHEYGPESAKHALKFISWCIAKKHDAILSSAISLAGRLDARVAECTFLRALRALDELDCIDSRGGSARESQTKLRSTIIQRLFNIYLARNDMPEAEYWLRRLDILSTDSSSKAPSLTATQLAYSLQQTSKMAQGVLDGLELDQDIRAKLHFSKLASFPAIHRAIRAGHVKSAQILSNVPAALRELDLIGRTALHVAAETGQVNSLELQFTPDTINERDAFQCTPLFLAACNGNFESFAHLVERGADTKARTIGGRSVLAAACSAGNMEITQYLLQKGIDPNDNPPGASSPLSEAASHGHTEICRVLLEKGALADSLTNPHILVLDTTTNNPPKEISEMSPSKHLLASEENSESLSDLASPIPSMQFLFSESSSVLANSTAADHEASTCESADSGFYDGQSCTTFGVSEISTSEHIWMQADFFYGMGDKEFGKMQNPLEIVE